MESDEGKLFVGGIAWDTTEEKLLDYFSKYGEVSQAVVMRDKTTGRPRGFGFVLFSDPSSIDSVLQDKHTIDGRVVEAKRALSREEQSAFRQDQSNAGRASGGAGNMRTKKIFVGGLPPTLAEEGFRQYFENYGHVTDAVIMYDQTTQRPRGFGFISFDSEDAVDRVLHKTFHDLNGKDVEVKRALPKEANPGSTNRGGGGSFQNFNSSRNSSGSYEDRAEGNRYMQPQGGSGGGAGFSQYPGYNAAGYSGYGGPTGSFGGYGGYGMGGYGGPTGGFPGPGGGYGASNAANAGYGGGPPNAMKAAWNSQNPGYGSSGYGGGAAAAAGGYGQTGQSPGGYGSSGGGGYGYGSGGGYGAVGGHTSGGGANGMLMAQSKHQLAVATWVVVVVAMEEEVVVRDGDQTLHKQLVVVVVMVMGNHGKDNSSRHKTLRIWYLFIYLCCFAERIVLDILGGSLDTVLFFTLKSYQ